MRPAAVLLVLSGAGSEAAGTSHLRSTVAKGRAILRALQGKVSGYAIPQFMIDPPGGGGKRPIN